MWNRLGKTQRAMADLLGFDESTLSKWTKREEKGEYPDTKTYERVSRVLLHDMSWLMGDNDALEWSPKMRRVQGVLRELAHEKKRGDLPSVRERLLFIHEHMIKHLPEIEAEPRLWVWYLRWDVPDWERFVADPNFMPGAFQVEGAAEITTIPARWFIDGNTECLKDMTSEEVRELSRLLRALNMDAVDAKRELTKRKTPRN